MPRRHTLALVILFAATAAHGTARTFVRSDAAAARLHVDAVCDVYNARPKLIRRVQLARVHVAGAAGVWKRSSDAALEKAEAASSFDADVADVYSRDGKVIYAIYTSGDASSDGGAREYCYANGRLARASTTLVDASTSESISRKRYFDPDGTMFADTGAVVRDIAKRRNAVLPTAPAQPIEIATYPTPRDLPFYEAYRAALAGTLPSL